MIKSNKGECLIDGRNIDLLYELNGIFALVLEEQPEMLTAVVTAWTPAIDSRIDNMDKLLVSALFNVSDDLRVRYEHDK